MEENTTMMILFVDESPELLRERLARYKLWATTRLYYSDNRSCVVFGADGDPYIGPQEPIRMLQNIPVEVDKILVFAGFLNTPLLEIQQMFARFRLAGIWVNACRSHNRTVVYCTNQQCTAFMAEIGRGKQIGNLLITVVDVIDMLGFQSDRSVLIQTPAPRFLITISNLPRIESSTDLLDTWNFFTRPPLLFPANVQINNNYGTARLGVLENPSWCVQGMSFSILGKTAYIAAVQDITSQPSLASQGPSRVPTLDLSPAESRSVQCLYASLENVPIYIYESIEGAIRRRFGSCAEFAIFSHKSTPRILFQIPTTAPTPHPNPRTPFSVDGLDLHATLLQKPAGNLFYIPHVHPQNAKEVKNILTYKFPDSEITEYPHMNAMSIRLTNVQARPHETFNFVSQTLGHVAAFPFYPIRIVVKVDQSLLSTNQNITDHFRSRHNLADVKTISTQFYSLYFHTPDLAEEFLVKHPESQASNDDGILAAYADPGIVLLHGLDSRVTAQHIANPFNSCDAPVLDVELKPSHSSAILMFRYMKDAIRTLLSETIFIGQTQALVATQTPSLFVLYSATIQNWSIDALRHELCRIASCRLRELVIYYHDRQTFISTSSSSATSYFETHTEFRLGADAFQVAKPGIYRSSTFDHTWYESLVNVESVDELMRSPDVLAKQFDTEAWKVCFTSYRATLGSRMDQELYNSYLQRFKGLFITVMLNTIGICQSRSYVAPSGRLVSVSPPNQSVSKVLPSSLPMVPHQRSTLNVEFSNGDCLDEALSLVQAGHNPVILHTTSADYPGGNYKTGGHNQEELLFLRSNYYMTLDQSLGFTAASMLYPIPDNTVIYSDRVTVFREGINKGFKLLEQPLPMSFIAAAPYQSDTSILEDEHRRAYILNMRRKLETVFFTALERRHDSIILDGFLEDRKSPYPELVAGIFKEALRAFGFHFRTILFCIYPRAADDDTLQIFKDTMNTGSLVAYGSGYHLTNAPLCMSGCFCQEINDSHHNSSFSHPTMCPDLHQCRSIDSDVHRELWCHVQVCPKAGDCPEWRNPAHSRSFSHPKPCSKRGLCSDFSKDHLVSFTHEPLCERGAQCGHRDDPKHSSSFRHRLPMCLHGTYCKDFNNAGHIRSFLHVFLPVCPLSPFRCGDKSEAHMEAFSHICPKGRSCGNIREPKHLRRFIHVSKPPCDAGENCTLLLDEEHVDMQAHSGYVDVRLNCPKGIDCPELFVQTHRQQFAHRRNMLPPCHSKGLNVGINFAQNAISMSSSLEKYISSLGPVSPAIISLIRKLKPGHRCTSQIFESIVTHGMVMSSENMSHLHDPEYVSREVRNHPRVRSITDRRPNENETVASERKRHVNDLINSRVREYIKMRKLAEACIPNPSLMTSQAQPMMKQRCIENGLCDEDVQELLRIAEEVGEACYKLNEKPMGPRITEDVVMGTNQHVFSVLGPNRGYYYGPIVIIFKQEILYHPDTNISPCAASRMHAKKVSDTRSWVMSENEDPVVVFNRNKLNPAVNRWDEALAKDIVTYFRTNGKKSRCDDVDDLRDRWKINDSHLAPEIHLPSLIPISYIHKILMPKNIYEKISETTKQRLKRDLPNFEERVLRLFNTPHEKDEKAYTPVSDEIMNHTWKYANYDCGMTGYAFSTEGSVEMQPTIIPGSFSTPGKGNIYFRAHGSHIILYLFSEIREGLVSGAVTTVYIRASEKKSEVYVFEGMVSHPKGLITSRKFLGLVKGFNDNLNHDDLIQYHMFVSQDQLNIRHFGSSYQFNRKDLKVTHSNLSAVRYVAVRSLNFITHFEDFRIGDALVANLDAPREVHQLLSDTAIGFNLEMVERKPNASNHKQASASAPQSQSATPATQGQSQPKSIVNPQQCTLQ
eukprot:TRINITY_DN8221_c0_g1_i8.p1 TRINITY_DN8221_c0_g1~~TRINITY_DN8221_c0_g1_i8.p1  ORF type:complete len:1865 (-),score=335.78 TRINITY_DN8221_c0_g1_i8:409-6003(-)